MIGILLFVYNRMVVYEIHDNGGRPFRVTVRDRGKGKAVSVEKSMNTFKRVNGKFVDIVAPHKHIFDVQVEKVFVGKASPGGGYDGLKPSEAEGNSLLLHLPDDKFMYIGDYIYTFEPVRGDTILRYYSDIGNSDVPYPYAVGKTHIYIMLDRVAVDKKVFDMSEPIYEQYYFPGRFGKLGDTEQERIKVMQEATHKFRSKTIHKRWFGP
jgi:hypothetical protein